MKIIMNANISARNPNRKNAHRGGSGPLFSSTKCFALQTGQPHYVIEIKDKIMLKHFDLFSGYGGFTLAIEKIYGLRNKIGGTQPIEEWKHDERIGLLPKSEQRDKPICIGFSEIDKYASAVLKYHWPNIKNYGDITKIDWPLVPDFDLLTGGSPCQDLSIAGRRAGLFGSRSGLFKEFMRAIKEKKPKYFIWENVKGALSSNNGWDFATVLNEMAEAGYALWWQVLNAKDFGVPQNRERIFVVGFRDGCPGEVFFEKGDAGQDNGDYIGDKEKQTVEPSGQDNGQEQIKSDNTNGRGGADTYLKYSPINSHGM